MKERKNNLSTKELNVQEKGNLELYVSRVGSKEKSQNKMCV